MNGAEYRRLREEKGLSLREVARRANISSVYLSDMERGNRPMPPEDSHLDRKLRDILEE